MKKFLIPVVTLLILGIALVGCGKSPAGSGSTTSGGGGGGTSNEVDMAATSFVQQSINVTAGTEVKFVDPQGSGGYHVLCLGDHQACKSNADGPADLNSASGVVFNNGDTKSYTFAKAGTYIVTCTVHPGMDVTINVK